MERTDVVVGVDGSTPSRQALRWAAAEAARRGSRLRVVHAYRPPWLVGEIAARADLDSVARARAQNVVDDALDQAREAAPGTPVSGTAVCCHPVPLLMENAGQSSLIVVGSHGHGGLGSVLLGSTGLQLATHATGPVAVVRGRTDRDTAPVVVGADGSTGGDVAVGTAFEAAAARRCFLTAVHTFAGAADARPRATGEAELHGWLEPWRNKYPEVQVETLAVPGDAASVLTALSSTAQLLVVGTRGRGGFTGLLLGSVGQKLIQYAHCPVLVAR